LCGAAVDSLCLSTIIVDILPTLRSPAELTEAFRQQGLRVTPQRQCIFRLLEGNDRHPSAEWVHQQARSEMPTISLKTVYQTLNDLASMGEIQVLDLGTGSARFDPNVGHHHHLVCDRCGRTQDVHVDVSSLKLARRERRDFSVGSAEVVFRGVCSSCSTTSQKESAREENFRRV
jgi:Fur family peroxide stress response transcriptional regulator